MNANVRAFLDMLAWSEIGPDMLTASDDGYDVIVGSTPGHMIQFRNYADHPNIYVQAVNSTAAGRYQILHRYWPHYKAQLGLSDFGHDAQDAYAIQQIREQRALEPLESGDLETAIARCANIWASLPGDTGYGQHQHTLADLRDVFVQAGGILSCNRGGK